jgi:hypothetical protein
MVHDAFLRDVLGHLAEDDHRLRLGNGPAMAGQQLDRLVVAGQCRTSLGEEHGRDQRLVRPFVQIPVVDGAAEDLGCLRVRRHPVGSANVDHVLPAAAAGFDGISGRVQPLVARQDELFHVGHGDNDGVLLVDPGDDRWLAIDADGSKFHLTSFVVRDVMARASRAASRAWLRQVSAADWTSGQDVAGAGAEADPSHAGAFAERLQTQLVSVQEEAALLAISQVD